MPTLAEKLKGISSLPGAAAKSVRKGGRRLKASPDWGVEVASRLFVPPVYVDAILTRPDAGKRFGVWLNTSSSFVVVVIVIVFLLQYLIGCGASEQQ